MAALQSLVTLTPALMSVYTANGAQESHREGLVILTGSPIELPHQRKRPDRPERLSMKKQHNPRRLALLRRKARQSISLA